MTNLKTQWTLDQTSTGSYWLIDSDGFSDLLKSKNAAKICTALNALHDVLKYMEGGHHLTCSKLDEMRMERLHWKCDCGYDALRAALGGEHE
jgi:hypothetical protein